MLKLPRASFWREWRTALALSAVLICVASHAKAATRHHHHRHHPRADVALHLPKAGEPLELHPLINAARPDLGRGNFTGLHAAWCAAGLNIWLHRAGYAASRSNLAISFARYGRATIEHIGAIAVLAHHVGIVVGVSKRGPILLSANHGHRVGIGPYSARQIVAYRDPV